MFTSRLKIHGVKFVFAEAKKPSRDMVMVYFSCAEIFFVIMTCAVRMLTLLDVVYELENM